MGGRRHLNEGDLFGIVRQVASKRIIGPPHVTLDSDFFSYLHLDSLDAVGILTALDNEFDLYIPDKVGQTFCTVRDIKDYLANPGVYFAQKVAIRGNFTLTGDSSAI